MAVYRSAFINLRSQIFLCRPPLREIESVPPIRKKIAMAAQLNSSLVQSYSLTNYGKEEYSFLFSFNSSKMLFFFA